MATSVQFWGKDNVIQAYEYANMPCWAIFAQRSILTSWEGDTVSEGSQSLEQFFDMLKDASHSDGCYQLRMYKTVKGDITNNTPYNASFNFRLQDADSDERLGTMGHTWRAINERLDKIETRLTDNQDEPDPDIPAWQQTIGAVLAKPEFQNLVLEKIVGLVKSIFSPRQSFAPGATVGSVPDEVLPTANDLYNALPADQRDKMDKAIPILMAHDPDVGGNLLKIATLLQTNPDRYRTLAAML